MVCLDSDILINFLRNEQKTIQLFQKLKEQGIKLSTTPINSFELLKGIPKSSKMDISKVKEFLSNFQILNFDFESSKKAAEIFEELKSKGESIDLADIMIASIAITNKKKLITKNTNHFERITKLILEKSE